MSTADSRDNLFAYTAAVVVLCLVCIFLFVWTQGRMNGVARPDVSFSQFGPYQIETQHLSISVSLAVQTSRGDASWPNSNRQTLNVLFKKLLSDTSPKALKMPNGLQTLQDNLTKECNAELHNKYVQAVLLTDFVAQERDS
jgi:hypothetical protein